MSAILTPEELETLRTDEFALQEFYLANERLLYHTASKFGNAEIEYEDLIAMGRLSFVKALNTYACDKNVKFSTYLVQIFYNDILAAMRLTKRRVPQVSLQEPCFTDEHGDPTTREDLIPYDARLADNLDFDYILNLVYDTMSTLKPKTQEIICLKLEGMRSLHIARHLGVSMAWVRRTISEFRYRLKDTLLKDGYLTGSEEFHYRDYYPPRQVKVRYKKKKMELDDTIKERIRSNFLH